MHIPRISCQVGETLKSKSVLLLGPRRTGKTRYIRNELTPDRVYNLLVNREFARLSANPGLIREELRDNDRLVVVDEIQKLPSLMDEIHDLIETSGIRFLLTGSSARKLRRTHTSLMAGRARVQHLLPFTSSELNTFDKKLFDIDKLLTFGSLPPVYLSDSPARELEDYTGTYLKEEIQAEAIVRKIENFSRFLRIAALSNAELVNFNKVARDAQVPPRTIIEHFHILEDTLLGVMLPPFRQAPSRKAYSMSKFYFFDVGVAHSLAGISQVPRGTPVFGKALEHLVFLELWAYKSYRNKAEPIQFWRTYDGSEVDFVIGDGIAVEVKASDMAHGGHLKGIKSLSKQHALKKKVVVSMDQRRRRLEGIDIMPLEGFLESLWAGELF
ncbi:MAG: ATP-binding protein [Elusimicrobia bacterium]|nr:ATP-binding protein [Elusimicrobiota bacterium]